EALDDAAARRPAELAVLGPLGLVGGGRDIAGRGLVGLGLARDFRLRRLFGLGDFFGGLRRLGDFLDLLALLRLFELGDLLCLALFGLLRLLGLGDFLLRTILVLLRLRL